MTQFINNLVQNKGSMKTRHVTEVVPLLAQAFPSLLMSIQMNSHVKACASTNNKEVSTSEATSSVTYSLFQFAP